MKKSPAPATLEAIIIGSGFAGIGMAIRLRKAGIDNFVILERASDVGGTWRDNTYPGVACDVESHLYSYSFEPYSDWSRVYAPQREILAYIKRCAEKYAVLPHIRFNTAVSSATFDEAAGQWVVRTSTGDELRARVLVSAAGLALSKPVIPSFEGADRFEGKSMHSARWDHGYELAGKTVAVVGTGASAIQIVPSIAPKVKQLYLFQRTPAWIVPKFDGDIPEKKKSAYRRSVLRQKLTRSLIYWRRELLATGLVIEPRLMKLLEKLASRYLEKMIPDPKLREKLRPRYRMGCKRILPSDDFYPALRRPNVELVTDRIAGLGAHSIRTEDGREREIDTVIYATGFEAAEVKPPFPIRGRGGRELNEAWKDGLEGYLGTTVAGFPNFFMIVGPNCGLGHSSMILMMESQFNYILDAVKQIRARGLKLVDVRPQVERAYNERLQQRLSKCVWNTGGCASWYLTRSGKNTTAWPGYTWEYRLRTRRFDLHNYDTVT